MNPPTPRSERYDRGDEILARIDGSDGHAVVDSLGDLGRYLVENSHVGSVTPKRRLERAAHQSRTPGSSG